MKNKSELIHTFVDLVKIDAPSRFERPVADYLINYFNKLGLALKEDDSGSKTGCDAGNLYIKIPGNVDASPIAFLSHMDTVTSSRALDLVLTEDKISSNGKTILGGDDRAGVALMCEIARCLSEGRVKEHGPIEMVFTVAEEIGLLGIKNINWNKFESKTAFVLDAGGPAGKIVTKAPSLEKINIKVTGRSAHAGVEPEKGINAIAIACKAVAETKQGRVDPETTVNIGKIRGGEAINIVPDNVTLEGEIRSFNDELLRKCCQDIKEKFQDTAESYGGKIVFDNNISFSTFSLPEGARPVKLAVKAALNAGLKYSVTYSGGGSDANVLNCNKIESIGVGIGVFGAHTNNEYVSIDDLNNSMLWLMEIVRLAHSE